MSDFSMTLDSRSYTRMMMVLSDLSEVESAAVVKKGLQEGLEIIVKQGKQNLQSSGLHLNNVYTGKRAGKSSHLVKSFKKYIKNKRVEYLRGYAGFSRPGGSVAHLLDRGTNERTRKDTLQKTGKVRATYFWTKAVESKSAAAQEELMESVRLSIQNIIKRNNM